MSTIPAPAEVGSRGKPDLEEKLKLSLLIVACMVLLIPSAAQADEFVREVTFELPATFETPVVVPITRVAVGRPILPRLKLPDYAALTKKAWKADMTLLKRQQHKSAAVVAFFNGDGKWLRATRHEKCWEIPWQRSCTIARASHKLHSELLRISTRRLLYEIPLTDNWTRAMRYAQRAFPGTYDWMEFISNRECRACYTTSAFICNYEGSGACGPMQFKEGTFYGHVYDAKAYLDSHGFITDARTWTWSSQLGQALTAGYMRYTHQDGCHWCL